MVTQYNHCTSFQNEGSIDAEHAAVWPWNIPNTVIIAYADDFHVQRVDVDTLDNDLVWLSGADPQERLSFERS
jgi:hypothetical protein